LAIIGLHQVICFGFLARVISDNDFMKKWAGFLTKMSELISAAITRHLMPIAPKAGY
jgi:hypothetical protein